MSRGTHSTMGRRGVRFAMAVAATVLLSAHAVAAGAGYDRVGKASWYGKRYQGRITASGQPFDMNGLTAAHRHLPFGTLVRVTNLANQRAIFVRIIDRGPYARGRLIDLSRHAAELLGFARKGVTRVRVQTEREARPSGTVPQKFQLPSHVRPIQLRPPEGWQR